MHPNRRAVLSLLLPVLSVVLIGGCAEHSDKIRITRLDDLPQHTYPVTGSVTDLVQSRSEVMKLAEAVRADILADLDTYEINDKSTLQRMHGTLLAIEMLEKDYPAALKRIEQIRRLEDKEAARLTSGLIAGSTIAARQDVGPDAALPAYKQAFRKHLAGRVDKLPWAVVEDTIQQSKGRTEIYSENLVLGSVQARLQPIVDKTGELNAGQAGSVIGMHLMLTERLPLKDDIVAVYQQAIDSNKRVKPDIWAARSATLSDRANYSPVLLGVWDSGTDPSVFAGQLFINEYEKPDGHDTDGNGFVDDVHGIAYDIHARRTTGLLCPLEDATPRMPGVMAHLKGLMDLQAAIDSPEASALKRHLSSLAPADVKGFLEDLGLAGNYAHGTHVAGIMTAGNPFARLLIARLSYDHRTIPVARTVEWGQRDGQKCRDTVEYFRQHGVRVVNMSWGEAQQDAEDSLEANGIGASAEERREIARQVFAYQRDGLYEAMKNAPDILFVCAAGNADNDVEFDEYIASSFELPNLITVGAVDQAGDPTSFTSFGRTVQVYGSGFEVESYVPGGQRMKMSGTSMASPQVANLAGKLLAVDPTLTPPELIKLIKKGADKKTAGGHTFLLLNPKRTVEMLQSRVATR